MVGDGGGGFGGCCRMRSNRLQGKQPKSNRFSSTKESWVVPPLTSGFAAGNKALMNGLLQSCGAVDLGRCQSLGVAWRRQLPREPKFRAAKVTEFRRRAWLALAAVDRLEPGRPAGKRSRAGSRRVWREPVEGWEKEPGRPVFWECPEPLCRSRKRKLWVIYDQQGHSKYQQIYDHRDMYCPRGGAAGPEWEAKLARAEEAKAKWGKARAELRAVQDWEEALEKSCC